MQHADSVLARHPTTDRCVFPWSPDKEPVDAEPAVCVSRTTTSLHAHLNHKHLNGFVWEKPPSSCTADDQIQGRQSSSPRLQAAVSAEEWEELSEEDSPAMQSRSSRLPDVTDEERAPSGSG